MQETTKKYTKQLLILLIGSVIVRTILAAFTELGNDEVYYRIFGLFPSLSYFDHAPMVGWLVHLTTLGSEQTLEIFVRLSSILIGTLNTYIIYRIAGANRSGFIAAMLATASIYASIIVGTFIMPDTPMALFWLLTLWIFLRILPPPPASASGDEVKRLPSGQMLLAGVTIGLAMLSKYTGLYLWGAAAAYILIFNRKWLTQWSLYVAPIISLIVFTPVLIWNFDNDFISFTFHSGRVVAQSSINWLYFGRELFGGVFYNNPINFILIICSIVLYAKGRRFIDRDSFWCLIIFSLPLILLFLTISLTRETLPHWAAPAYFALIILAAKWLSTSKSGIRWALISVGFTFVVAVFGLLQINYGIISLSDKNASPSELGRGDVTLDMYGWRDLGTDFASILSKDQAEGLIARNPLLINYRWDESAHLDTYVALPNSLNLITIGTLSDAHFYETISKKRGGLNLSQGGYFIISSRYFATDLPEFEALDIDPNKIDYTIPIFRSGDHIVNFFVYRISAR